MTKLRSALRFLGHGLTNLQRTAALVPASPALVRAMVDAVPADTRCLVELGPGTGAVTRGLLARLGPKAHVHAIELDPGFVDHLRKHLPDKRLRLTHGTAEETPRLLAADGCTGPTEVVVSSLGVSLMPRELRDRILAAALGVLGERGVFVQYQHLTARLLTWTPDLGLARFDARRWLEREFGRVEERVVLAHLPPAAVLACRAPGRLLGAG